MLTEAPDPEETLAGPRGLGMWIWQLRHCDGGDLGAIVARCQRSGVRWVCIKSGDDNANGQISPELIRTFDAASIGVFTWNYCIPGALDTALQVKQIARLYDLGIDGHFLDAEIEWELRGDRRPEAADFAKRLRDAIGTGPDAWLGHAPWPIVDAHPTFPWKEFGAITDAQCDQLYWTMNFPYVKPVDFMARADKCWEMLAARIPEAATLRCPVGSCFNSRQPATPDDVAAFLDRYAGGPFVSLYSYDACPHDVWAMLEQRAAG
jgi:hypothetical protein